LAFAFTDATTDTTSFSTALELRRKKRPTDFFFGAYYFFGSTKESGGSRATTENRLLGRTRIDRDLTDRSFAFGQVSAEYDEIQRLSLRTDPVAGVGYRFVAREKLTISSRSGPGYVYQRYFGGDTEDYFTILFGGDLEADLPYGSKFRWRAEYLPAVPDWKDNYLIRTTADWTMSISGWLDFKIAVFDTYNNQPAPVPIATVSPRPLEFRFDFDKATTGQIGGKGLFCSMPPERWSGRQPSHPAAIFSAVPWKF
jgi:putative salt-induced outer membrane protein YdiY